MSPLETLSRCDALGIRLVARGGMIGIAPGADACLKSLIAEHKTALLAMLAPCPGCRRALDRGRCWHCQHRWCESCYRQSTGSAFIATCVVCGATPGLAAPEVTCAHAIRAQIIGNGAIVKGNSRADTTRTDSPGVPPESEMPARTA
jgi:hypothetical protein